MGPRLTGPSPSDDELARRWAAAHPGMSASAPLVRGWLRLMWRLAAPLAARGASPSAITAAGGGLGVLALAAAWPGGRWPALAALALDISAALAFRRHRTTIMPNRPATALVTGGPFALSRNPIYVANTLLVGGPLPFTVQAVRDVQDRWVQGRRIWNQHTYHITNVREDGTIPQFEKPHWLGLNTFRTQAQIQNGGTCQPPPPG